MQKSQLAKRPDVIRLMIQAIREAFAVLKEMGVPVTPSKFRFLEIFPLFLQVRVWQKVLAGRDMEMLAALHCQNAPTEKKQLAQDLQVLARSTSLQTPSLDKLSAYIQSL